MIKYNYIWASLRDSFKFYLSLPEAYLAFMQTYEKEQN